MGTLRVIKALLRAEGPVTKYWIEKESGVYDAGPILKRLARQGIVRVIADYNPPRYEIDRNNAFVKELARFLARVGYLF